MRVPKNMYIPSATLAHLRRWEGFRAEAYPDPGSKDGNPWTIGYGHTSDAYLRVKEGDAISEAQAEAALLHDAMEATADIEKLVKVPLTENQMGALLSFVFNLGASQFAGSTLLRELNKGNYDAVPAQLARWIYNDGARMQGLVNRRASEAGLWAKGDFVASRNIVAETEDLAKDAFEDLPPLTKVREAVAGKGKLALAAAGGAGLVAAPVGYGGYVVAGFAVLAVGVLAVRFFRSRQ